MQLKKKPKKGKAKPGAQKGGAGKHKASAGKLANKKTSRLAKQGKLNLADKKKKRKKMNLDLKQQKLAATHNNTNDEINGEDEMELAEGNDLTDEDTEFFDHLQNAKEFARMDLSAE